MDNNTANHSGEFDDLFGVNTATTETKAPNTKNGSVPATTETIRPKDLETYSDTEITNVNAIITNITDTRTPIAIFFGPASSGKTMALLRMIRYFSNNLGYTVIPDRVFRPAHDRHFKRMCDGLITMANSDFAPAPNDDISFMLVNVYDEGGSPVMQILEAPGEHYFNPSIPDAPFPAYIEQIIQSVPNRKIWCYFAEQDWKDQSDRNNYAIKISKMQALTPHDKVLFLFNKCDKHMHQYDQNGSPRTNLYLRKAEQQYPGIFNRYRNTGIAKFLFGPYRFTPVCFSSGTFTDAGNNRQRWTVGNERYCAKLWEAMRK